MRRLALLVVMSLAFGAPAGAQDGGRIHAPDVQASLRGAVGEAPAGPDEPRPDPLAALVPMPPAVAPIGSRPASGDSRQCRNRCNRDYYFCLSADEESCAPVWVKCSAACGA